MQHALTRLRDDGWRVGIDGFGGATSLLEHAWRASPCSS